MDLPGNIARRRKELDLTLEQLAARCGVSRAMLSAVERGEKSPTIHVLCRVAAGLVCTVSELIEEHPPHPLQVVRADARPTLRDDDSGVERQLLSTTLMHYGLEAVWYSVPEGETAGPFAPEELGRIEHLTVVTGRMGFGHGEEEVRLAPGDSVTYGPAEPVFYRNRGRGVCTAFLLIDKSELRRG
jgi:transcriptional regulator with XRE-family HTH domain